MITIRLYYYNKLDAPMDGLLVQVYYSYNSTIITIRLYYYYYYYYY